MRAATMLSIATILVTVCWAVSVPAMAQQPLPPPGEWRLEQLDGKPASPDADLTATFADGRVSGSGGVNRYFGSYKADGDALTVSDIGSTKMAGPGHLMAQESRFFAALAATRSARMADGKLILVDEAGKERLVFSRPAAAPDPALAGTEWRLEQLDGKPVSPDADLTAAFADGRVSGSAGINQYSGSYTLDGSALTFGDLGSTKMAGPGHLMLQESRFLSALEATRTARIADGKLTLTDEAGKERLLLSRIQWEPIDAGGPVDLADGMLWVPLRPLAAWMGATVQWDRAKRVAIVQRGAKRLAVDARRNVASDGGMQWTGKYRMLKRSGVLYVPLEALVSAMGARLMAPEDDHVLRIEVGTRRGTLTAP